MATRPGYREDCVAEPLQRAPGLGPARVAEIIKATARPATDGAAAGIVDACAALASLGGADACR